MITFEHFCRWPNLFFILSFEIDGTFWLRNDQFCFSQYSRHQFHQNQVSLHQLCPTSDVPYIKRQIFWNPLTTITTTFFPCLRSKYSTIVFNFLTGLFLFYLQTFVSKFLEIFQDQFKYLPFLINLLFFFNLNPGEFKSPRSYIFLCFTTFAYSTSSVLLRRFWNFDKEVPRGIPVSTKIVSVVDISSIYSSIHNFSVVFGF